MTANNECEHIFPLPLGGPNDSVRLPCIKCGVKFEDAKFANNAENVKEKLIKDIEKFYIESYGEDRDGNSTNDSYVDWNGLADFIILDRKNILSILKEISIHPYYKYFEAETLRGNIDETLRKAGVII